MAYDSAWAFNFQSWEHCVLRTFFEALISVLFKLQSKYYGYYPKTCRWHKYFVMLNFYKGLGLPVNDFSPLFFSAEGSACQLAHDISTVGSQWEPGNIPLSVSHENEYIYHHHFSLVNQWGVIVKL